MVQHIAIEKIDENGKTLESCSVNFADIVNLLPKSDIKQILPLISYIDSYGDTYFNRLQIKDLVDEFITLETEEQFKTLKTEIEIVIEFIRSVDVHQYIRFAGD